MKAIQSRNRWSSLLFSSHSAVEKCGFISVPCLCAAAIEVKDSFSHSSTNPESSAESSCCLGRLSVLHIAVSIFACMWEGKTMVNSTAACRRDQQVRLCSHWTRWGQQKTLISKCLWAPGRGDFQRPESKSWFTVWFHSWWCFLWVHSPMFFQKHQISPDFCWIWCLFCVRYHWITLSPMPASFFSLACVPLISIACFYTSSNSCLFLKPSAIFLPMLRLRPPCLNTCMSLSGLVAVQLLPFLKWTCDARDICPRAVDPFFSSSKHTQKSWESSSSLLIFCPPWPLPPTEVTPCGLRDQSHVSWRLLENLYYLHLLHFCPRLFSSPNLFPSFSLVH